MPIIFCFYNQLVAIRATECIVAQVSICDQKFTGLQGILKEEDYHVHALLLALHALTFPCVSHPQTTYICMCQNYVLPNSCLCY